MALNGFESISTQAQHAAHRTASASPTTEDVDELDQDQDEPEHDNDVGMDEDEVDELDSDQDELEDDEPAPAANGSKGKGRKTGERVPGQSLIPASRIESILDADGSGGHMSKEAEFMLSVATEEFIKRLADAGSKHAAKEKRSIIYYRDVAAEAQDRKDFTFLRDTIPEPLTLAEALRRRAAKEKELLEDNPATSTSAPFPALSSATSLASTPVSAYRKLEPDSISNAHAASSRSRSKKQANGKEREKETVVNGVTGASASASAGSSGPRRQRDNKGRWSQSQGANDGDAQSSASAPGHVSTKPRTGSVGSRPSSARIRNRTARASASDAQQHRPQNVQEPLPVNGVHLTNGAARPHTHSSSPGEREWGMPPPSLPPASSSPSELGYDPAPTLMSDDRWTTSHGPLGPASAFLDDRRAPGSVFGARTGIGENPGRTIYSQQRVSHSNR